MKTRHAEKLLFLLRPNKTQHLSRTCFTLFLPILFLAFTIQLEAAPGDRVQVGSAGEWKNTVTGTTLDNRLYTVSRDGYLYETNPATGIYRRVGGQDFGNVRLMFAAGSLLYTVEKDGNLYQVSPTNGTWKKIGAEASWKNTKYLTALNDRVYSVEQNGTLFVTNPATGDYKPLGTVGRFKNIQAMFGTKGSIYVITSSLYRVRPTTGNARQVGAAGEWSNTRKDVGVVLKDRLYTIEKTGTLFETNPATGAYQQIGGVAAFKDVRLMFAAKNSLYIVDTNGTFHRVGVR